MAGKQKPIRIGLVGAGQNTRYKHIPGLLAQDGVELVAVANRRRASSERVARDYGVARVCDHWRQVVEADDLDAIVIGTWPYLHCPVTLAALAAGKHVLTEARMAMNLSEAEMMLAASRQAPHLVTQIVPPAAGRSTMTPPSGGSLPTAISVTSWPSRSSSRAASLTARRRCTGDTTRSIPVST